MYCDTQCFCKSVLLHVMVFNAKCQREDTVYGGSAIRNKNNTVNHQFFGFGFVQIHRLKHEQGTIHK